MSIKLCGECGQEIQNDASYKAWRESAKSADQPVELPYDKGNWVDNDMVLAIAKHPDFLKMLYAFRDPNIVDNTIVPAQVAFFAVMALKPWLLKRESSAPFLQNRADGVDGHYCIARYNPKGFTEFYEAGKWVSATSLIFHLGKSKQIEGEMP